MRYSYEYKLNCVEMYRERKCLGDTRGKILFFSDFKYEYKRNNIL